MLDLAKLAPEPAGFGNCGECAYRDGGSAAICYACASAGTEPPHHTRCPICDQRRPLGTCGNYWCSRPESDRYFDVVWAVAMRTGRLEAAINRYKFSGRRAWAVIFGRVLVGYLDDNEDIFGNFDLIIPMPTSVGMGARRSWDHIGLMVDKASVEAAGRWPFRATPPVVIKTADTPSMTSLSGSERRRVAETDLRSALTLSDPTAVNDQSVLVIDDVFTEGSTLREVARLLKIAGATEVSEVVLARQPWR